MAKRLNSVLGVDVGSQTIKVVELRIQGHQFVLNAVGETKTPEGTVDHMQIYDADSVGLTLKELCSSAGVSSPNVVLSIAGQKGVLVRIVNDVPQDANDDELRQHMDWEKDRSNPFDEDVQLSYEKMERPSADGKPQILMAIAPLSGVQRAVQLLKKAGKKPHAFDVEPLSLARLLDHGYKDDLRGKAVCVVEIGHLSTAINVYADGNLMMPRQVPMGGDMISRALADGLGLGPDEAEEHKKTSFEIPETASFAQNLNPFDLGGDAGTQTQEFQPYNPFGDADADAGSPEAPEEGGVGETMFEAPVPAVDPEIERAYQATAGSLEQLVEEVRRSIDYYASQGGSVDSILLCGGGAKLKGLEGYLERSIGQKVETLDPTRSFAVNPKKPEAADLEGVPAQFAVAIGNCLHVAY